MNAMYLSAQEALATPSREDGVSEEVEAQQRTWGCDVLQRMGGALSLPQVTIATAQMLLMRFFHAASLARYDIKDAALGALFLACKVQETTRAPRAVLTVAHHCLTREVLSVLEPLYTDLKARMFSAERDILRALGFRVAVRPPHRYILAFLKILNCHQNKSVAQRAWNYLNDSVRTRAAVTYEPSVIAVAAIYVSVRVERVALPPRWWTLFEASLEDIEQVGLQLLQLYQQPVGKYQKLVE